ncbi:hypothetical protein FTO74_01230 [Granulicella sp. WH15]|uniref:hypothetical protein n=1 Tax=Granulicella sp. WH15 TaxID=2602070 RepID=UPI001366CA9A|nr:hypothetical protein [Granulicella sp. WH15]QHN02155.1 hypothetical protein FTO74_01230 [Granulicella sp. WH15]
METGKKLALGGVVVLLLAGVVEVLWLHHERNADVAPVKAVAYKIDPDDNVFLKKEHPDTLKDAKDLKGRKLWVSAGGQMDYFPFNGKADYAKSQGVLLGAEPIVVVDAMEQVAPKSATFRIPGGEKQVLLVFTKGDQPTKYAVPVGYREKGLYTYFTDEIFFYDDPHELYKHWGPEVWKAVDEHRAILGMNERQVQMALGQVSKSGQDTIGDRTVEYDAQGHPQRVTFVHNKATAITPE